MVYVANMVLFMDMYLTIFNPFQGDKARMKTTVIVYASFTLLVLGFIFSFLHVDNFGLALVGTCLLFMFPNTYFVLKSWTRLK